YARKLILEDEDIEEMMETFAYHKGETEVFFVRNGKKMRCSEKVSPCKALMAELRTFLSANDIKLL
ncbi:MAG: hypothetical protein IKZ28_06990, partial [Clostridia bacterium]|nr:hypothetical protein [Clostridia bacterium]